MLSSTGSSKKLLCLLALALLLIAAAPSAFAHGSHQERLAALEGALARDPGRAALIYQRALLHYYHGDWSQSLADIQRALDTNPAVSDALLLRGRVYLAMGRLVHADVALTQFIGENPSHPTAWAARAKTRADRGLYSQAAADYGEAIRHQDPGIPDYYLKRANAYAAATPPEVAAAIAGLDDGLRALGSLATLELAAVELELRRGSYAAALSRIERIQAQSPRTETWLVRRGEILEQADRSGEAKQAYASALAAIAELPPHRRSTAAVARTEILASEGLARSSRNPADSDEATRP